jgi:hypothetical protein
MWKFIVKLDYSCTNYGNISDTHCVTSQVAEKIQKFLMPKVELSRIHELDVLVHTDNTVVAVAPIWLRVMFIAVTLSKLVFHKVSRDRPATSITADSVAGTTLESEVIVSTFSATGWPAIAGPNSSGANTVLQSKWIQARESRLQTQWQSVTFAVVNFLLWHCPQPAIYFLLFRRYSCVLPVAQLFIASLVLAREIVYLATAVLALTTCPVYLLLDPAVVWQECSTAHQGRMRLSTYMLVPHGYVTLCLANRFQGRSQAFLAIARVQHSIDRLASYSALLAWTGAIETPTALLVGYTATALSLAVFPPPSLLLTDGSAWSHPLSWPAFSVVAAGVTLATWVVRDWPSSAACKIHADNRLLPLVEKAAGVAPSVFRALLSALSMLVLNMLQKCWQSPRCLRTRQSVACQKGWRAISRGSNASLELRGDTETLANAERVEELIAQIEAKGVGVQEEIAMLREVCAATNERHTRELAFAKHGVLRTLLTGHGSAVANEHQHIVGWVAIAGPDSVSYTRDVALPDGGRSSGTRTVGNDRQSTWQEARVALGLTWWRAVGVSVTKLLLWHCSQPLAFLLVFDTYFL